MRNVTRRLVHGVIVGSLSSALASLCVPVHAAAKAPLIFEASPGAAEAGPAFLSRGDGYDVLVGANGVTLILPAQGGHPDGRVRLAFLGAAPASRLVATEELPGKVSYLVGSDVTAWRSGLATYAAIAQVDPYPGVSVSYRGDRRQLDLEVTIAPGVDARSIRLGFSGADGMRTDPSTGDLVLSLDGSELRLGKPTVRQALHEGLATSAANFVVRGENEVGILPPRYQDDSPVTLRIRVTRAAPAATPSATDVVRIAADSAGNSYVAGRVLAAPNQPADAFVTKLGPDGSTRLYTTYFGGEGEDTPLGIAVNQAGEVVVTGRTTSSTFPVVGALAGKLRGRSDAFVAKLAADGASFIYSSYLGGDGDDEGRAVDLDREGSVWITGRTSGAGFPTTNAAAQRQAGGSSDAFAVRLSPDGSQLLGSSLLGGSGQDSGNAVRVDPFGNAYVAGTTRSADFPVVNALQREIGGGTTSSAGDAFVAKLDGAAALLFSTFLGGEGEDSATGLGVDGSGAVHVAGRTGSTAFAAPGGSGAGGRFVATLSPDGAELRQLSRFGASSVESDEGFAVDDEGIAWVAGGDGALASRIGTDGRVLDRLPGVRVRGETVVDDLALARGGAIAAGVTTDAGRSAPTVLETSPSGGQVFASGSSGAPASANCPGTIQFSNGAGTGLWQTPGNWNLGRLPNSTDDVCIPAGFAVTLSSGAQTVNSLFVDSTGSLTISAGSLSVAATSQTNGSFTLQGSGTLSGAGDFITAGSFSWTGGTVTGAGNLVANAGIAFSGTSAKLLLSSRLLTTNGMTTWTGTGGISVGTGAVINNAGTWDCQSDAAFSNGFGGTATFNNQSGATFKKSAGSGTTGIGITFNNSGTTAVQSGTINLSGGGTSPGSFTGTAGTTLQFSLGHTLSSSSIIVADAVTFSAGTTSVAGALTANATTISGATVSFDSPSAELTTTLTISSGTRQGTGAINVSGLTTWTGGTMTGAGTTNANGGLSTSGAIGRNLLGSHTLNVAGTTTWTGGGIGIGTGAVINNSGTWDCQSDASFATGFGGTATFNNLLGATFKKSAGAGTTGVGATFNNAGGVVIHTGTVNFSGGGASSGSFTGDAGATLQFGGGTHALSTTSSVNADTVVCSAGTVNVDGAYSAVAGTTVSGATANFDPVGTVTSVGSALTISAGMANFNSGEAINATTLSQSGGTLTGTDAVSISGLTTWTAGSMTGAGVTNTNGGMNASGATGRTLLTRTLNTAGSTTWTGTGGFGIGTGAAIDNSGTWDCQSDASFATGFGGTATFANLLGATFKKSAGAGTTSVAATFDNSGSVIIQSGTINFTNGGTSSGSFTGNAGTTLQFGGGTHALGTTSNVNADRVVLSAGTVNVDGSYTAAAATTVSGATANFDPVGTVTSVGSALTISSGIANFSSGEAIIPTTLSQSGGTLQGADTVSVSGLTTWTGGVETGVGTTNTNGGMNASGPNGRTLTTRTLNTAGATTWTEAGGFGMGLGAVVNNSGTWDSQSNASFTIGFGGTATFNNLGIGTFKKSVATGTTGVAVTFNNSGSVIIKTGTVNLSGGGTSSGSFSGDAGTTLLFGGGTHTLGTTSSVNADTVVFNLGTVNVDGGYAAAAATTVSGATANFDPVGTLTNIGNVLTISAGFANFSSGEAVNTVTLSQSAGTLQGTDTVSVSGLTTWSGGTMTGAGITNTNGGMNLSGGSGRTLLTRVVNTAGPTTWTGTGGIGSGLGAVINNSGTWDCQTDASFSNGFGGSVTFNNLASGTFKKSAGAGSTVLTLTFNNAGAVQALAAALNFTIGYTQTAGSTTLNGGTIASPVTMNIQGGTLTGIGNVNASVNVTTTGQTAPGVTIGTLTVAGNYTQSSTGALSVDIGGSTPGTQYDQFNLTGTGAASLAGTLNVALANGFAPVGGDSFTIMNFVSRSGTFATLNVPALSQGCWLPVYNPTSVVLQVWTTAQEITGSAFGADKSTLSWSALPPQSGPAATYDVMRGRTSELPVGGKPNETCLVSATAATSLSDASVPPLGVAFYYLVRGTNLCGRGNYGTASNGSPRNATACP